MPRESKTTKEEKAAKEQQTAVEKPDQEDKWEMPEETNNQTADAPKEGSFVSKVDNESNNKPESRQEDNQDRPRFSDRRDGPSRFDDRRPERFGDDRRGRFDDRPRYDDRRSDRFGDDRRPDRFADDRRGRFDDRPRYEDRRPERFGDDRRPERFGDDRRGRFDDRPRYEDRDYPAKRGFEGDRFDRRYDEYPEKRRRSTREDDVPPNETLGIFNLSYNLTPRDLDEYLESKLADFKDNFTTKLITDRMTGKCKGFAFLKFNSIEDSTKAKALLENGEIQGNPFRVAFSIGEKRRERDDDYRRRPDEEYPRRD